MTISINKVPLSIDELVRFVKETLELIEIDLPLGLREFTIGKGQAIASIGAVQYPEEYPIDGVELACEGFDVDYFVISTRFPDGTSSVVLRTNLNMVLKIDNVDRNVQVCKDPEGNDKDIPFFFRPIKSEINIPISTN